MKASKSLRILIISLLFATACPPAPGVRPTSTRTRLPPPPATVGPATPAPTSACTQRSDWIEYRVGAGEDIDDIAFKFNTSILVLVIGNCLTNPALTEGQVFRIPPSATAGSATPAPTSVCTQRSDWTEYRVGAGEDLDDIAVKFNISILVLVIGNCLTNPALTEGQVLRVPSVALTAGPATTQLQPLTPTPCGPPPGWSIYIVQRGDTLNAIASRTGTSPQRLKLANCLDSDFIYVGQALFVPYQPVATLTTTPTPPTQTITPTPSHTVEVPPPVSPPPPESTVAQSVTPEPTLAGPHLNIVPPSGRVGTVFIISLVDFRANENITVQVILVATQQVIYSTSAQMNQTGSGTVQFASQTSNSAGSYVVVARGDAGSVAYHQLEISP